MSISAGGDKPINFSKEKTETNTIPIFSNGIEKDGLYGYTDIATIDEESITISARGTIGFCRIRTEPYVPIIRLLVIIPSKLLSIDYVLLAISSLINAGEGSSIPQLTVPTIKEVYLPIPPYLEQLKITKAFEKIENEIEIINREYIQLKAYINRAKAKILDLAMHGKLVPQDPADEPAADMLRRINPKAKIITDNPHLRNIPKGWCWIKLKDICIKIVDGDHNPPVGQTNDTGFYMISASNIVNNNITISPSRFITEEQFILCNNRTNVSKGDVLLTTVGSIGRTAIYSLDKNITFQRSVSVISTQILNTYLKFILDSPDVQKYMIDNAKGTAQKGFYINQLCSLPIPVPSMNEQQRIVAKIEELYSVLDQIEASLRS